jgi:hypothetical protein
MRLAVESMADPLVRKRLGDIGVDIPPRDQQMPEALGARHKAEAEKWWPLIKAANIKAEWWNRRPVSVLRPGWLEIGGH